MKRITEETLLNYQFVSDPRISPNGKYVSFISQQADIKKNGYNGDIYLIEDGKVLRLTGQGDAKTACWTPENTLLFPAKRDQSLKQAETLGAQITAFYEISPEGGEASLAFTLPLKAKGLAYLAGDLYLFVREYDQSRPETSEEALKKAKQDQVYLQFEEWPIWRNNIGITSGKHNQLCLYNRRTGEIIYVSDQEQDLIKVSHQGAKLIYSTAAFENGVRAQEVSVTTYDAEKGEYQQILRPGDLWLRNCEVWGELWGDKILLIGSDGKTHGRSQSPVFWLYDPKTKDMKLFKDYEYGINYRCAGNDSKLGAGQGMKVVGDRVYFLSTVNYQTYVRYLDKNGNISDYLTPAGVADSFDIMGDRLVYCGFFDDNLAEIYENGKQLSHMNDQLLREYTVISPAHQVFTNTDGYEIDGWVMKPADYQPGKKYPAILSVHGGPRSLHGELFYNEHQLWAARGYFVLFCNPRGSEGKGDDFAHIWGRYGTIDFKDLMEFTDEMLKRYPDVDGNRVGVAGGSYGGFMVNWIVGHTDRFKAACTQRCVTNYITKCLTGDNGYTFNFTQIDTDPWTDFEKTWATSPLKYAENFKTPTLVIQSDEDYCCWASEGYQMYTALKMQGVDTKMCLFHGENHELSRSGKPKARIARMSEIVDWMDRYLK